jgi:hypothetical protein
MLARIAELQGKIRAVREGQERMLARAQSDRAQSALFPPPPGRTDAEPSAHARSFQHMKAALLALPEPEAHFAPTDTEAQRRMPETALEYSTDVLAALQGTTTCMPMGLTRSMEEEFRHNADGKFFDVFRYVVYETAAETLDALRLSGGGADKVQVRDRGRSGWRLADFAERTKAREAKLTLAEVAAVRLYSSFARVAWLLNDALRSRRPDDIQAWATTICVTTSAIIKLSQLSSPDATVYSGMPPCTFSALETFAGCRSAAESYLQYGFLPSTLDPQQNALYCGGKYTESVVWIVSSTFSSRPADISSISMYPEECELLFPPCTTLEIIAVERLEKLNKWLVLVRPHICTMRLYTDELLYPWSSPNDALTHQEYDEVMEAGMAHAKGGEAGVGEGKYANDLRDLLTGEPKAAALGLEDYMVFDLLARLEAISPEEVAATEDALRKQGVPQDCRCDFKKIALIESEFRNNKDKLCGDGKTLWDWFHYVAHQAASAESVRWGNRDTGHDGMRLVDFLETPQAKKAKLSLEHLLVLRLYSATPVSFELNAPLRNFKRDEATGLVVKPIRMGGEHAFPVTVMVLSEAIKRLRDSEGKKVVILWRGLKNMNLEHDSDFLLAGGVEMSPMSTSYLLKTALVYSHSSHSIIFKIVTRSFMERGADLEWISCFPEEKVCIALCSTSSTMQLHHHSSARSIARSLSCHFPPPKRLH